MPFQNPANSPMSMKTDGYIQYIKSKTAQISMKKSHSMLKSPKAASRYSHLSVRRKSIMNEVNDNEKFSQTFKQMQVNQMRLNLERHAINSITKLNPSKMK